jgi:hypothetical protein
MSRHRAEVAYALLAVPYERVEPRTVSRVDPAGDLAAVVDAADFDRRCARRESREWIDLVQAVRGGAWIDPGVIAGAECRYGD